MLAHDVPLQAPDGLGRAQSCPGPLPGSRQLCWLDSSSAAGCSCRAGVASTGLGATLLLLLHSCAGSVLQALTLRGDLLQFAADSTHQNYMCIVQAGVIHEVQVLADDE